MDTSAGTCALDGDETLPQQSARTLRADRTTVFLNNGKYDLASSSGTSHQLRQSTLATADSAYCRKLRSRKHDAACRAASIVTLRMGGDGMGYASTSARARLESSNANPFNGSSRNQNVECRLPLGLLFFTFGIGTDVWRETTLREWRTDGMLVHVCGLTLQILPNGHENAQTHRTTTSSASGFATAEESRKWPGRTSRWTRPQSCACVQPAGPPTLLRNLGDGAAGQLCVVQPQEKAMDCSPKSSVL